MLALTVQSEKNDENYYVEQSLTWTGFESYILNRPVSLKCYR
jgi:hypothetical protein